MKRRRLVCTVFCLFLLHTLYAQRQFGNNFYGVNPYSYNMAYASDTRGLQASVQFSGQNAGLPGSPTTAHLLLATSLLEDQAGAGLRAYRNTAGVFQTTLLSTEFSYVLHFDKHSAHVLRFGLGGGALWENIDLEAINKNGYTNTADPMLYDSSVNTMDIQVGMGLAYQYRKFKAAVAVPYLVALYQKQYAALSNLIPSLSYGFDVFDQWQITPIFLINMMPAGLTLYDVMVLSEWEKGFWWQMGYRSNQAMIGGVGASVKQIKVGYSFELPFGQHGNSIGPQHAIMLRFTSKKEIFTTEKKKKRLFGRRKGKTKTETDESEGTN